MNLRKISVTWKARLILYKYIIATCVELDTEEYSGKLKEDFMDSVKLLEEVLEE